MDLDELTKDFKTQPTYMFKRKLNELVRTNHRFSNLDTKNRKTVIDIIGKYADRIKKGFGMSDYNIQQEGYKLYKDRLHNGVSEEDLKDIKEIMGMFKK